MEATLTSKGQITVPKLVRDRLHLHAGDKFDFVLKGENRLELGGTEQAHDRQG